MPPARQWPSVRAMGTPKRAAGVATRRSQAVAMARPPPTHQPSITASVGTGSVSTAAKKASTLCSYATPSSADLKARNWAMSVPAMKALPPPPEKATARIDVSARILPQISLSCSYIVQVMALCACGRSKATRAIAPSTAKRTVPSPAAASCPLMLVLASKLVQAHSIIMKQHVLLRRRTIRDRGEEAAINVVEGAGEAIDREVAGEHAALDAEDCNGVADDGCVGL